VLSLHLFAADCQPQAQDPFTLGLVMLYRVGAAVPCGPYLNYLQRPSSTSSCCGVTRPDLARLPVLPVGACSSLSIFAVGVMPYNHRSIICSC
jgi:preprotein translocase subunit SecY